MAYFVLTALIRGYKDTSCKLVHQVLDSTFPNCVQSAKTRFAHLHVTAIPRTHAVANSVGSSPDVLPSNQTIKVLILNVIASKFIKILEESLPLDLVYFFAAAIRTLTGKVYYFFFYYYFFYVTINLYFVQEILYGTRPIKSKNKSDENK